MRIVLHQQPKNGGRMSMAHPRAQPTLFRIAFKMLQDITLRKTLLTINFLWNGDV